MLLVLMILMGSLALVSCSEERFPAAAINPNSEASACLYGANAMIDVAKEAVNDAGSRPARREARRVLVEGWEVRDGR
ncbi:MAG: hypothetical protein WDZ52_07995 [Pseudohongiellaceae bacterium]